MCIKTKLTYEEIRENEMIRVYIEQGNSVLGALGFTEHSAAHAVKVAETAGMILKELGYSEEEIRLAKIAGYMHDIGNSINRTDHAHSGALLAFQILKDMEISHEDIAVIMSAIGNHDEKTGSAVSAVSAALILADKTDVRRNRVRNKIKASFDIHDRVNYAAESSKLAVDKEKGVIHLDIQLDESMSSFLDYFEIFLDRMLMCRRAAEHLKVKFKFTANGSKVW